MALNIRKISSDKFPAEQRTFIYLAGVCLGILESSGNTELIGDILTAVLGVIVGTTTLAVTIRKIDDSSNESFLKQLTNSEKDMLPITLLLFGIVCGVLLVSSGASI
jgi:hypothetical protein